MVRQTEPGGTGISVNPGFGGRTILAIASGHGDSGDATYSKISMLRCGYDGNFIQETVLSKSAKYETYNISYYQENGQLCVSRQSLGACSVLFIMSR